MTEATHGPTALVLPYPPSVNHLYQRTRNGGVFLSDEARRYKLVAQAIARKADMELLHCMVTVTIIAYRPRKRGDADNIQKVVFDALNGIAWDDDSQVVEYHVYRRDDKLDPRLEVTIEPATLMSPVR